MKTGSVGSEESQSLWANLCPLPRHKLKHGGQKLRGVPKALCLPFLIPYKVQIAKLWGHRELRGLPSLMAPLFPVPCSILALTTSWML